MTSLDSILYQMILSTLRSASITSASPGKVNHFIGLETPGTGTLLEVEDEIKIAIREVMGELSNDPESAADLADTLLDAENKKKKKGSLEKDISSAAGKGISAAQNPASIVAQGINLLPHAILISFAISLAPLIFDVLTKPGGPLDLRFKRIIDDEINGFLSRQTQKDTEMGVRQVIIQSKTGFTASNGVNNYNTLRGIREGGVDEERLSRNGMKDHSKGVFDIG